MLEGIVRAALDPDELWALAAGARPPGGSRAAGTGAARRGAGGGRPPRPARHQPARHVPHPGRGAGAAPGGGRSPGPALRCPRPSRSCLRAASGGVRPPRRTARGRGRPGPGRGGPRQPDRQRAPLRTGGRAGDGGGVTGSSGRGPGIGRRSQTGSAGRWPGGRAVRFDSPARGRRRRRARSGDRRLLRGGTRPAGVGGGPCRWGQPGVLHPPRGRVAAWPGCWS